MFHPSHFLSEIGEELPEMKDILIDERDQYLTQKIRTAPGKRIVAVVGAGHVPGIQHYWNLPVDMEALEQIPPKSQWSTLIKWIIQISQITLII